MLSRKDFLALEDKNIGTHCVPELGGEVGLACFTVDEADQISKLGEGDVPATVRIVIMGACDDKGDRLFTDDDIPVLRKKLAKVVGPLSNAILRHNGLIGDEAKNASGETESDDSASDSP